MNNNQSSKAYAAACAPLTQKRRDAEAEARAKLERAQADPDPHRDVVMQRRRRSVEWLRGVNRQRRRKAALAQRH